MRDLDKAAKYICDRIETTLKNYGREVRREALLSLAINVTGKPHLWRLVVRRTGTIDVEPMGRYSRDFPIPDLDKHIKDALVDEFDFSVNERDTGGTVRQMLPRALSGAPIALPAASEVE